MSCVVFSTMTVNTDTTGLIRMIPLDSKPFLSLVRCTVDF